MTTPPSYGVDYLGDFRIGEVVRQDADGSFVLKFYGRKTLPAQAIQGGHDLEPGDRISWRLPSLYQRSVAPPAKLLSYYDAELEEWRFPQTRGSYGEDTLDAVCRLCGEWTAEKSSCGRRYHELQGSWEATPPKGNIAIEFNAKESEDEEDCIVCLVPICDRCSDEHDIGIRDRVAIVETPFLIDSCNRMND